MESDKTTRRSSGYCQRAVAPVVIAALLATAIPSNANAQGEAKEFGRQLFTNIAGALLAGGALAIVALLRPDPPLQPDSRDVDFGRTRPGAESTHALVLTNKSKKVTVLESVSVSGPFGLAESFQGPRELQAGELITIALTFKPSTAEKAKGQLAVRTHAGDKTKVKTMKIQLKGDARGDK